MLGLQGTTVRKITNSVNKSQRQINTYPNTKLRGYTKKRDRKGIGMTGGKTQNKQETCAICGKEYEAEYWEINGEEKYSGAVVDGKQVCDFCWGDEYENRTPFNISYQMTGYVEGHENILKSHAITTRELPEFIDNLVRKKGYKLDWILVRYSCLGADMGNKMHNHG